MTTPKETILIVNMFSGKHPVENIAHEIINTLRADDGNYYLYVPPNGKPKQYKGISKVLMVRHLGGGRYEIVGRGFVDTTMPSDVKDQKEILSSIEYSGKSLAEIMPAVGERFDGESEQITFKATRCEMPNSPIFINSSAEKAHFDIAAGEIFLPTGFLADGRKKHLLWHAQRRFVDRATEKEIYDTLNLLFDSEDEELFWVDFPSVEEFSPDTSEDGARFLSLINKEESELAYSNLLAHFLDENPPLCSRFIRFLLGLSRIDDSPVQDLIPYDISRERHHIDIMINTRNRVIILENKVHASLREDRWSDDSSPSEGELVGGQLQDYVDKVTEATDKEVLVYVICPSYNWLYQDYKASLKGDEGQGRCLLVKYRDDYLEAPVVSYADILSVLEEFGAQSEINGGEKERGYFKDFLSMLAWQDIDHSTDQSRRFLRLSQKRFLRAIEICKASDSQHN